MVWVRWVQVVNAVFGAAYLLLGARFAMEYAWLDGAVLAFLRRSTEPLRLPLGYLFPTTSDPAGHPLVWSLLATMAALGVLHVALRAVLRRSSRPAHDDD